MDFTLNQDIRLRDNTWRRIVLVPTEVVMTVMLYDPTHVPAGLNVVSIPLGLLDDVEYLSDMFADERVQVFKHIVEMLGNYYNNLC